VSEDGGNEAQGAGDGKREEERERKRKRKRKRKREIARRGGRRRGGRDRGRVSGAGLVDVHQGALDRLLQLEVDAGHGAQVPLLDGCLYDSISERREEGERWARGGGGERERERKSRACYSVSISARATVYEQ
jgi:hypothetical protein